MSPIYTCGRCGRMAHHGPCPSGSGWPAAQPRAATTTPTPIRYPEPAVCPVCNGTGSVPAGFYSNGVSSSTNNETCRTCKGVGAINPMLLPTPGPAPRPSEETA